MQKPPKVEEQAPDFSWLVQEKPQKLSDFFDRYIVLYFYPKDNTPGCTIEGREFAMRQPQFAEHNAVIIGVSKDDEKCHQGFAERSGINFMLVPDTEAEACNAYGVIQEKKGMFGRKYVGIVRSTFIIAPGGKIAAVWSPVSVTNHAEKVLQTVIQLQSK